jgi:hypothetical protein
MSGGHWDYSGSRIQLALEEIAEDERVRARFPALAKTLDHLSSILYDMEHDLDWDFSDDSYIPDDEVFERTVLRDIRNAEGGK